MRPRREEATALLGDWAARGPELARTVRASRPWATASYVADLALRLSLGAEYLARREVTDPAAAEALDRRVRCCSPGPGGCVVTAVLFVLVEIGLAVLVWRLGDRARKQQLTARAAALFAGVCAVLLMLLIVTDWPLTDWPTPAINEFWDEHGVLSGTVQSVLLFGVGLLSYEAGQLRAQERLDESVTAAGLGGIVDHLVDAEVGLAFLSSPEPPDAHGWTWAPGKPLEWLRQGRERLHRNAADRTGDPRTWPATLPETTDPEWRKELVDQCIRRLLVALRDWTPLIATSRNGTRVLVAIAELRKDLVELDAHLRDDPQVVEPLLVSLRARARLLAYFLELKSGADPLRPEVLDTFAPLPPTPGSLEWAADPSGRDLFGAEWTKDLQTATEALSRGSVTARFGARARAGRPAAPGRRRAAGRAERPGAPGGLLTQAARASASAAARSCSGGASLADRGRRQRLGGREQPDRRVGLARARRPGSHRRAGTAPRRTLPEPVAQLDRLRRWRTGGRQVAEHQRGPRQRDAPRRGARVGSRCSAIASASAANTRAVSPSASSRAISARVLRSTGGPRDVALRAHDGQRCLVGPSLAVDVAARALGHRQDVAAPASTAGRGRAPPPPPRLPRPARRPRRSRRRTPGWRRGRCGRPPRSAGRRAARRPRAPSRP